MKKDKYSIIIIDDEALCINNLCQSLKELEKFEIIGIEQKPEVGEKLILKKRPDLLFIDVEMPHITGIQLVQSIKDKVDWNMQVVFYTAYDKYLLEALRTSAFDYLLKPYKEEDFKTVINRFLEYVENKDNTSSFKAQVSDLYSHKDVRFLITTIRGYQMINIKDVGYFEYNPIKRLWYIALKGKLVNIKRGITSNDILQLSNNFVQVNQHQIINAEYLDTIEGKKCLLSAPFENKPFVISRKYQENVEDHFFMI